MMATIAYMVAGMVATVPHMVATMAQMVATVPRMVAALARMLAALVIMVTSTSQPWRQKLLYESSGESHRIPTELGENPHRSPGAVGLLPELASNSVRPAASLCEFSKTSVLT